MTEILCNVVRLLLANKNFKLFRSMSATMVTNLRRSKLEILISGYIQSQNMDGLYALKQYFINYTLCMTEKYFQILISNNPNQNLGDRKDDKFAEIEQIESNINLNSEYKINRNKCLKCLHSKDNILKLHCYYKTVKESTRSKVSSFENNVIEYQCIDCKYYIAFNYRNKVNEYHGTEDGDDEIGLIYTKISNTTQVSLFGNKKIKSCDDKQEIIENEETTKECADCGSKMFQTESRIRRGWLKTRTDVYWCKNCELVLTEYESREGIYEDF